MLEVQGIYFFTLCCVRLRYFRSLLKAFIEVLDCWSRGREKIITKNILGKINHSNISLFDINPLQVSDHKSLIINFGLVIINIWTNQPCMFSKIWNGMALN